MKEYVDGWCGSWFLIFQELVLSITTNFALLVFHMLTVLLTCRRLEYGRDFSINFSLPSLYWRRHHLHLSLECSFPSSFFLHLFLSLWELPPFAPSFIIAWTLYFCMFSPVPSFLPYFFPLFHPPPFSAGLFWSLPGAHLWIYFLSQCWGPHVKCLCWRC